MTTPDEDTFQLIKQAVLFENVELLGDLLEENPAAAHTPDGYGRTPLMLAAHNGRLEAVRCIIDKSSVSLELASSIGGKTALHLAAEAGETAVVRLLLANGADASRLDDGGHCALEGAHMAGHVDTAEALIDAIQAEATRLTELHARALAACVDGDEAVLRAVLDGLNARQRDAVLNGAPTQAEQPGAESALISACLHGRLALVEYLLAAHASHALVHPSTGDTVIHAAISSQNREVLERVLTAFPALIAEKNVDGSTCLHWAAECGNVQVVQCLLEHPFDEALMQEIPAGMARCYRFPMDVNEGDAACRTPLYLAVAKAHTQVVEYLLDFRVDLACSPPARGCPFQVDVYCSRGRTPLMVAAYNQTLPLISLLLERGADVNLPLALLEHEREGRCVGSGALLEAVRADAPPIVHFLLGKGALDMDNRALCLAGQTNNEKLQRVLLCRLVVPDHEHKVNKRNVDLGGQMLGQSLLSSALCPSKAAWLQWQGAALRQLHSDWLVAAAMQVNTKLKTSRLALAAITRLDLSDNQLAVFPSVLFQMPSLKVLNLSGNALSRIEVPTYYISSTSLEHLILKGNALEQLSPQVLSAFPQLTLLDVSGNRLSQLPEYIWLAPRLKELNAADNRLTSLPMVATRRERLTRTTAVGREDEGKEETLPPNVTQRALTRLNHWQHGINLSKVDDDELKPDWPVTCSGTLQTLNLAGNKLEHVPACLACTCPRLQTLCLARNHLSTLGPVSCLPAHLRTLDVSSNRLTALFTPPTAVSRVCHAVAPSGNVGGGGGEGAGRMHRMGRDRQHRSRSKSAVRSQRSLSVQRMGGGGGAGGAAALESGGSFDDACVHKRHDSLEWLKTCNMAGNELASLALSDGRRLIAPALTVLDVSNNNLAKVCPEVSRLPGLSVFSLSGNKRLDSLPPEMGQLARLWSLSLKDCPLKEPLHSMVNVDKCKTVDVVAYLKTILEESKTYRHLKLVVLGASGAGRSTVWEGLRAEGDAKGAPRVAGSARVCEWKCDARKVKGEQPLPAITFSAWDFVGQRDYHAVHPYLISRRAVYAVVWRATDGDAALAEVADWLQAIHARAPNAYTVLVATHVDQIDANPARFPPGYLLDMEKKVRHRFMMSDGDKRGMPRVCECVFVNARSRQHVKNIAVALQRTGCEVRVGKERALEAPVPSSYIALIKVAREAAMEMKKEGADPLMTMDEFRDRAHKRMTVKFGRAFRDEVEFSAACAFLHDAGEIVHMEDANLRELCFIDPLWLCDLLAQVVQLRSPMCPVGLLPVDALSLMVSKLRSSKALSHTMMPLLHKFEVALLCQSRQLVVPSLLPDEYQLRAGYPGGQVKLPTRVGDWRVRVRESEKKEEPAAAASLRSVGSAGTLAIQSLIYRQHERISRVSLDELPPASPSKNPPTPPDDCMFTFSYNKEDQLRRVYSLAYVPAGFWPRLITRIIGEQNIAKAVAEMFCCESQEDAALLAAACRGHVHAEWLVWQTGIEMLVKGHSLFVLKQFLPQAEVRDMDYSSVEWHCRGEAGRWRPFRLSDGALLEMLLPSLTITAQSDLLGRRAEMRTDTRGASRLLAVVADMVDTLLEDWYPSLGTRFVHSSEGELLVNRFVACPGCARAASDGRKMSRDDLDVQEKRESVCARSKTVGDIRHAVVRVHAFSVEECMLAARGTGMDECPEHGAVSLRDAAPDTVFADIEPALFLTHDAVRKGRMLGHGAFGFVFRATVRTRSGDVLEVAQKMLEPADPGANGRPSAVAAYKASSAKWARDPIEHAARAYTTCRQELSLLSRMRHPHVLSLVGVCLRPLSLIVDLAPQGALNALISSYRKSGTRLPLPVLSESAAQVARALEYLHAQHVIYRDLKSENVLAWRFPAPYQPAGAQDVLLKLGDYGISRSVLPSGGAKGFGGTEGFMAPEIVRFNGEEEYTAKVDVFSYGMLLYELLTLKLPFEGEEHVKEMLLDGARPELLPHELLFPCSLLDLMVLCWSAHPDARPTSSQLVSICSAPELTHLVDVCVLDEALPPRAQLTLLTSDEDDTDEFEGQLWLTSSGDQLYVLSFTQFGWIDSKSVLAGSRSAWLERVRDWVWAVTESGETAQWSAALQEAGARLSLPSLAHPLVAAPQMIGNNLLFVVTQRVMMLLRLNSSNGATLVDTFESPHAIHSAVVVQNASGRQIWTGHADGLITVHHISSDDERFAFSSSLAHPDENRGGGVGGEDARAALKSPVRLLVAARDGSMVWSALDRGHRVYGWEVATRQQTGVLDVRKVLPASETIHTLDMEVVADSRVSCLCVLDRVEGAHLYVGTDRGVLVVASAGQLQPLVACRPYAGELFAVLAMEGPAGEDEQRREGSTGSVDSRLSWVRERVSETVERFRTPSVTAPIAQNPTAVIITIGSQFRSLAHRFVNPKTHKIKDVYAAAIWRPEDWI